MENQVLVAYATKYGATEEIAERIGLGDGHCGCVEGTGAYWIGFIKNGES